MYKPGLITALQADYEDAAEKYKVARNEDPDDAEHLLHRMKMLACVMGYTQQMIDGTIGKMPMGMVASRASSM